MYVYIYTYVFPACRERESEGELVRLRLGVLRPKGHPLGKQVSFRVIKCFVGLDVVTVLKYEPCQGKGLFAKLLGLGMRAPLLLLL